MCVGVRPAGDRGAAIIGSAVRGLIIVEAVATEGPWADVSGVITGPNAPAKKGLGRDVRPEMV